MADFRAMEGRESTPPCSSALDPTPTSPLEPTASDAACARAARASADAEFASVAQLGRAACTPQVVEMFLAAGSGSTAGAVLLIAVALLAPALVAFVLVADESHSGAERDRLISRNVGGPALRRLWVGGKKQKQENTRGPGGPHLQTRPRGGIDHI